MTRVAILYVLPLMVLACHSTASTLENSNLVISITSGAARENAGETQIINLAPSLSKTYKNNNNVNIFATSEMFIGLQQPIYRALDGQFGIAAVVTNAAHLQGMVWDDTNPLFDNKSYRYKVKHKRIAAKAKFLFNNKLNFLPEISPWAAASLGVAFNHAYLFTNKPVTDGAVPDNNFTNHTKLGLVYTLSLGVHKAINKNFDAAVGYEFADWGKSELGRAFGQSMGAGLKLNHLYIHSFTFSISYLDKDRQLW